MSTQPKEPKKKGFSIARLFMSNRFVLIFSLFAAIVLWFIMAINNTESRARVVDEIPIRVELSEAVQDEGYQIFWMSDRTARVSVTGNSLTVNQLGENDIKIVPVDASSLTRTGYYTLNLTAQQNSALSDYKVDTVYPGSVNIFIDKYAEKTFTIEQNIQYTVAEGYYASKPTLSAEKVTISGPESEVSEVGKVVVAKSLDAALQTGREFTQNLVFYDKEGNLMSNLHHMSASVEQVTVKIDVLKEATLPVLVQYKNAPSGIDLSDILTLSPETLTVGYLKEDEKELTSVPLDEIDLSQISLSNNTVKVEIGLPKGYTNISGVKAVTATFDLTGYTAQSFTVQKFRVRNAPKGKTVTVITDELPVTLMGPAAVLSTLKDTALTAEINLAGRSDESGNFAVPVTIQLASRYKSWAVGSYEVYVNLADKE